MNQPVVDRLCFGDAQRYIRATIVAVEIVGIAIGLRAAIDLFCRLLHEAVEIGLAPGGRFAARSIGAHRDGKTGGRVPEIAADPDIVPQPSTQKMLELADGYAGLGNFDLGIIAPIT